MKAMAVAISIVFGVTGFVGVAQADPWKDESGHGRNHRYYEHDHRYRDHHRPRYYRDRYVKRSYKEEYRRGNCKIERKWSGDEYKEEIKCKRR